MPYIAEEDRDDLEPHAAREAMTGGELCFQLTCLADGFLAGNVSYSAWSEVCTALETTKLEIYRRIMIPYEDQKIQINGDVLITKVPRIGAIAAETSRA